MDITEVRLACLQMAAQKYKDEPVPPAEIMALAKKYESFVMGVPVAYQEPAGAD